MNILLLKMKKIRIVLIGLICVLPTVANAGIVTFTDRATYEAYINGAVVDDMLDVLQASGSTGIRAGYNWSMSDYGCVTGGCGNNLSQGFNYADNYIWTYNNGAFTFGNTIFGFGIDFGAYQNANTQISLNGSFSNFTTTGGFFGIASDNNVGFTVVNYTKSTGFGLFDKVTYATAAYNDVPEPAPLALLGFGLMGLAIARRRHVKK